MGDLIEIGRFHTGGNCRFSGIFIGLVHEPTGYSQGWKKIIRSKSVCFLLVVVPGSGRVGRGSEEKKRGQKVDSPRFTEPQYKICNGEGWGFRVSVLISRVFCKTQ